MISSLVKSSSQTNAPSNLSHTKVCYQKQNEPAPLAKASTKINVWGGISARGATSLVMFQGILAATRYTEILGTDRASTATDSDPVSTETTAGDSSSHRW